MRKSVDRGYKAFWLWMTVSLSVLITSCIPREQPVQINMGNPTTKSQVLSLGGPDYINQVYFDLSSNQIVGENHREKWDLAFDCNPGEFNIWLNGAKGVLVGKCGTIDFSDHVSTNGAIWGWDHPSGNPDSNAIGKWADFPGYSPVSLMEVYILDLGKDNDLNPLGLRKFQIVDFINDTYRIRFAKLDGSDEKTVDLKRDSRYNFVYLSMGPMAGEVFVEPKKDTYDLLFTRYWETFYSPSYLNYSVVGALINPSNVAVAVDSIKSFDDIEINDVLSYNFSGKWDAIGYDWKYFDLTNSSYTVIANRTYIIRDYSGDYYKLRFTGFVNGTGERGYPAFDFQVL